MYLRPCHHGNNELLRSLTNVNLLPVYQLLLLTVEPPNKGHIDLRRDSDINTAVLSFVERLSSFRGSQCVETIGRVILASQAVPFVERSIIITRSL